MGRKLKFFAIGLVPGLLVMMFFLNMKGASCSGYLPNSRVIAETLSKKFKYTTEVTAQMAQYKMDEKYLRDHIILDGKIDFDQSHAQQKPCPTYVLVSADKKYKLSFEKCDSTATMQSLEMVQ